MYWSMQTPAPNPGTLQGLAGISSFFMPLLAGHLFFLDLCLELPGIWQGFEKSTYLYSLKPLKGDGAFTVNKIDKFLHYNVQSPPNAWDWVGG